MRLGCEAGLAVRSQHWHRHGDSVTLVFVLIQGFVDFTSLAYRMCITVVVPFLRLTATIFVYLVKSRCMRYLALHRVRHLPWLPCYSLLASVIIPCACLIPMLSLLKAPLYVKGLHDQFTINKLILAFDSVGLIEEYRTMA